MSLMAKVPPFNYYSRLPKSDRAFSGDSEKTVLVDTNTDSVFPGRPRRKWLSPALTIGGLVLAALLSFALGRHSRPLDEVACVDTAWEDVREAVRFKTVEFDPFFGKAKSPYMGAPNAEVDQRWEDLAASEQLELNGRDLTIDHLFMPVRAFGVDRSTLVKLNRTKAAVRYPQSGTYKAAIEVFHQLHCLNYLRMYTSYEYYSVRHPVMVSETAEQRFDHKDHCIESLRQAIMCHADLNVYTYHWSHHLDQPVGDLYSRHRCLDWDYFSDWVAEHGLHEPKPKKPLNAEIWDG